jgi:hypothetical protein
MKIQEKGNTIIMQIDGVDLEIMKEEIIGKKSDLNTILERIIEVENIMREYFQNNHLHYTNSVFSHPFGVMKIVIEKCLEDDDKK